MGTPRQILNMQTILIPIMLVAAVAVGATPTADPQYYHTWLGAHVPLQRVVYSHLLPLAPAPNSEGRNPVTTHKMGSFGMRSIGYNLKRVVQLLKPAAQGGNQLTQYQGTTTDDLKANIKEWVEESKNRMANIFKSYDDDDNKKVDAREMRSGDVRFLAGKIDKITTEKENKATIKNVKDVDGDDTTLNEAEFTSVYNDKKWLIYDWERVKAFKKRDLNADDYVDNQELHAVGKTTEGENPTLKEWKTTIKFVEDTLTANTDDGKLDFEEFAALMFAGTQLN